MNDTDIPAPGCLTFIARTLGAATLVGLLALLSANLAAAPPTTTAAAGADARTEIQSGGCNLTRAAVAAPAASVAGDTDAAPAGLTNFTAQDGTGKSRQYLLQAPSHYNPTRAYPLTFVFHAAGGNAKQAVSWGLQSAANASAAAFFAFPDGIPFKNYGVGWDDAAAGYDLPFFDAMLKAVGAAYCVDLSRVFAAGFSWGGDFVVTLACNRGGAVRAIAANSTDDEFSDTSDYRTYQNLPCPGQGHPSVRFQHAIGSDPQYPAPLFATTSRLFQSLNACGPTSTSLPRTNTAMFCESYTACTAEYIECKFDPRIGHALPPNWAKDTWAYFSKF